MIRWTAVAATGLMLAGCGGGGVVAQEKVTVRETVTSVLPATTTQPAEPSRSATTAAAVPTDSVEAPAAAAESWAMPDLIGKNLQDAQNAIQILTNYKVFFSSSTDLTGKGRQQLVDRNWQVCSSTPPPGTIFTRGTAIDFGVVKMGTESCP